MGTHPIFESDFDCLTDFVNNKSEWFWTLPPFVPKRVATRKRFASCKRIDLRMSKPSTRLSLLTRRGERRSSRLNEPNSSKICVQRQSAKRWRQKSRRAI